MSSIAKVFIPRVLGGVKMSSIRTAFMDSKIGKPTSIDMHRKLNEKNNRYSFVFIDIDLFDTNEAKAFSESMNTRGVYQLHYDRKNYWEVKSFLQKKDRTSKKASTLTETNTLPTGAADLENSGEQKPKEFVEESSFETLSNYVRFLYPPLEMYSQSKFLPMFAKHAAEMEADCQMIDEDCDALIVPRQELNPAASQFIPMFIAIKENSSNEFDAIQALCRELATKPSAFTQVARAEINEEFDEILNCIHHVRFCNSIVV
jgi:hypothetical protein